MTQEMVGHVFQPELQIGTYTAGEVIGQPMAFRAGKAGAGGRAERGAGGIVRRIVLWEEQGDTPEIDLYFFDASNAVPVFPDDGEAFTISSDNQRNYISKVVIAADDWVSEGSKKVAVKEAVDIDFASSTATAYIVAVARSAYAVENDNDLMVVVRGWAGG